MRGLILGIPSRKGKEGIGLLDLSREDLIKRVISLEAEKEGLRRGAAAEIENLSQKMRDFVDEKVRADEEIAELKGRLNESLQIREQLQVKVAELEYTLAEQEKALYESQMELRLVNSSMDLLEKKLEESTKGAVETITLDEIKKVVKPISSQTRRPDLYRAVKNVKDILSRTSRKKKDS
jgi:septal ring factor EnvC (AmiA/AmiB activator)